MVASFSDTYQTNGLHFRLTQPALWQTLWKRHHRFSTDGTWDKVLTALHAEADGAGRIDWRVSVDSTIARVHQHGATAARSALKPTSFTGGSVE
jgi:transposase